MFFFRFKPRINDPDNTLLASLLCAHFGQRQYFISSHSDTVNVLFSPSPPDTQSAKATVVDLLSGLLSFYQVMCFEPENYQWVTQAFGVNACELHRRLGGAVELQDLILQCRGVKPSIPASVFQTLHEISLSVNLSNQPFGEDELSAALLCMRMKFGNDQLWRFAYKTLLSRVLAPLDEVHVVTPPQSEFFPAQPRPTREREPTGCGLFCGY